MTLFNKKREKSENGLRIALVGPCSSGKSTLAVILKATGYEVRQPVQEHSNVKDMWQRLSKPDILIFLDASYEAIRLRRPHHDRGMAGVAEQMRRLTHARAHCDLYIDTTDLDPLEIQHLALAFLDGLK